MCVQQCWLLWEIQKYSRSRLQQYREFVLRSKINVLSLFNCLAYVNVVQLLPDHTRVPLLKSVYDHWMTMLFCTCIKLKWTCHRVWFCRRSGVTSLITHPSFEIILWVELSKIKFQLHLNVHFLGKHLYSFKTIVERSSYCCWSRKTKYLNKFPSLINLRVHTILRNIRELRM